MTLTARLISSNRLPADAFDKAVCRRYNDMALIAVESTEIGKNTLATRYVKKGAATLQEALESAEKNHPAELLDLGEMFGTEDLPPLTIVTNRDAYYGAVGILFPSVQKRLREMYGDRFIVLPSSVHEVLAAPVELFEDADLSGMVQAINSAEVEEQERLSDTAFLAEFTPGGEMTLKAI